MRQLSAGSDIDGDHAAIGRHPDAGLQLRFRDWPVADMDDQPFGLRRRLGKLGAGILAIADLIGQPVKAADNLVDATQNADSFAAVSSAIKNCALVMSKIANDMRLLSSGPCGGIEELQLPARQPGSSIMPGKINPVIPEVVTQAAFLVAGNDVTISMAVEAGQLELNAFEPIIFFCLFQSLEVLTHAVDTFRQRCVEGIFVDVDHCRELLMKSTVIEIGRSHV